MPRTGALLAPKTVGRHQENAPLWEKQNNGRDVSGGWQYALKLATVYS